MLPLGLRALIGGAAPMMGNAARATGNAIAAHPLAATVGGLGAMAAIDSAHLTSTEAAQDQMVRHSRHLGNDRYEMGRQYGPQMAEDSTRAHIIWQDIHNTVLSSAPDYDSYKRMMGRVKLRFDQQPIPMEKNLLNPKEFRAIKEGGAWGMPFGLGDGQ